MVGKQQLFGLVGVKEFDCILDLIKAIISFKITICVYFSEILDMNYYVAIEHITIPHEIKKGIKATFSSNMIDLSRRCFDFNQWRSSPNGFRSQSEVLF